ncbi:MAG TPA: cytochrome c biogenesis protein ResB [Candidatus Nitrosotenuis sp.]|nr:cytochrome c biogenesis protein ResB [Candidatus Nitrosotenuis sp.]
MPEATAAQKTRNLGKVLWRTLASVSTGIILLILVTVASVAGTLILQRPITEPEQLQRAYSPETLRWLDAAGLTDVFHSWWFVGLMILLCANIVAASIERFPTAWRFFSRPYLRPDAHFLGGLPMQKEISIRNLKEGAEAAERALQKLGYRPRRIGSSGEFSLFAERNRFARLAAYVVHLSLLLILLGGIVDAVWGYRGYMMLSLNQQSGEIDLRNGQMKTLPFEIRCEGAGQENYASGQPKRWWSKLAVVENGREVARKEIEVNDPLTYRGIRFFQSGYGSTGEVSRIRLLARHKAGDGHAHEVVLQPGESATLDGQAQVRLVSFVPDLVIVGNRIETRSNQPNNPAIQLVVETKSGAEKVWLFPKYPALAHPDNAPFSFEFVDFDMGYFTGLQVSYEPGQWAVWTGCILMAVGLVMAFYFIHVRFWVVPVSDGRGRNTLWVGGSASKSREEFSEQFQKLVNEIEQQLAAGASFRQHEAAAAMRA